MKKIFILLLILLPLGLSAQRFNGGLLVGLNASHINGDTWGGFRKASLVGGAFVSTEFQNKWGGQLEIRYAGKGSASVPDGTLQRKIRLQYIELPAMVTYDAFKLVQLQAGASINYLFSAAQNDGIGYEEFEQFDKFEAAAFIGGEYKFSNRISLNVRSATSILPIYAQYSGAIDEYAMVNIVVTFAVYYRFNN